MGVLKFFRSLVLRPATVPAEEVLSVRFKGDSHQRCEAILGQSEHTRLTDLIGEALKVSELIYRHGKDTVVHCQVTDGKIEMYIDGPDGPDGGGGLPMEDDVVVQLFPWAAQSAA